MSADDPPPLFYVITLVPAIIWAGIFLGWGWWMKELRWAAVGPLVATNVWQVRWIEGLPDAYGQGRGWVTQAYMGPSTPFHRYTPRTSVPQLIRILSPPRQLVLATVAKWSPRTRVYLLICSFCGGLAAVGIPIIFYWVFWVR